MDIIAYQKAMKAKKAMKKLNDRLGTGVQDIHPNVKTRLESLEAKDPHVTLTNRVSDVEAVTAANLNKHNLRMNTLVNLNKYKLTELALDDFGDSSGIDTEKSSGHTYDAANKKVTIASGQAQADVVMLPEALTVNPSMIVVSQTTNSKINDSKNADLNTGIKANVDFTNSQLQLHLTGTTGGYGVTDATDGLPNNAFTALTQYTGQEAYRAFNNSWDANNNVGSYFTGSGSNTANQWLKVGFATAKTIGKMVYQADGYDSYKCGMKNFKVQASTDGATWVDQYTGVAAQNGAKQTFTWTPTGAFRYWRIFMIDNYGNTAYIAISEIELYEGSPTVATYTPNGSYESPVVDLGSNYKNFVKLVKAVITGKNIVPAQTAANGSVISSSGSEPYAAWRSFDGTSADYGWIPGAAATVAAPQWMGYDFGVATKLSHYAISASSQPIRSPKDFTLEGWNGSAWVTLDTRSSLTTWSAAERKEFALASEASYTKYRLSVTAENSAQCIINELELIYKAALGTVTISTATSNDNTTFSAYAPLNADDTIASPSGRYIKIKADLTANASSQKVVLNDFIAGESTQFQSDTQLLFDGSLKLQTVYQDLNIPIDSSYSDPGSSLLRKPIDKANFKTIEKLELI